ncbi:MAG: HAD-IIA family hydrolase [Planctomycetes bacterium]|nr:HAD-IIA family hydrolase [Planctomycetota bacterium]
MKRYRGYIFDLDGTIYRGPSLIPGAREMVEWLRDEGAGCVFLSNKAIQTRNTYAEKLNRLGIPVELDDVINSSFVTASFLAEHETAARIFVIGERPLLDELAAAGIRMAESPEETDIVVISFDRTFHYGKLDFAYNAIMNGARILATNADKTCPVEDGIELPDAASIIGALKAITGKEPERVLGKPSTLILDVACHRLGLAPAECVMVGDRLETDMVMGRAAGMGTALVLTGVTRRSDLDQAGVKPDYILESVADIRGSQSPGP